VFNVHSILFSSQPILHPSIVVVSLACLLCQLSLWSKAIVTTDSLETRLRLNCIVCNGYLHLLRFDGQPPIAEVKVACLLQRMGVQRVLCHDRSEVCPSWEAGPGLRGCDARDSSKTCLNSLSTTGFRPRGATLTKVHVVY
jgi:hypothetical protein